jgi:hypothetical protein
MDSDVHVAVQEHVQSHVKQLVCPLCQDSLSIHEATHWLWYQFLFLRNLKSTLAVRVCMELLSQHSCILMSLLPAIILLVVV